MKTQKYPNLTPWQPGQSGNPEGRKPGSKNLSTIVREILDHEADGKVLAKNSIGELTEGESMTYAKAVVVATINKALQGNMQAVQWLTEQQCRSAVTEKQTIKEPLIISLIKPRNDSTVN